MTCDKCQSESGTLMERAGIWICAACLPDHDRHIMACKDNRIPLLLEVIANRLNENLDVYVQSQRRSRCQFIATHAGNQRATVDGMSISPAPTQGIFNASCGGE